MSRCFGIAFVLCGLTTCGAPVSPAPKDDLSERWWWKGGPPRIEVTWLGCAEAQNVLETQERALVDLGTYDPFMGADPPCDRVAPVSGDSRFIEIVLHALRKAVAGQYPDRIVERYYFARFSSVKLGVVAHGAERTLVADRKAPAVIRFSSVEYGYHTATDPRQRRASLAGADSSLLPEAHQSNR